MILLLIEIFLNSLGRSIVTLDEELITPLSSAIS
jgi:hypothetical protein